MRSRACQRAGPGVIGGAEAETGTDGIHPDVPGDEVVRVAGSKGMIVRFLLPEMMAGFLFIGETCSLL